MMGLFTGFLKGASFATAAVLITLQIHLANRQHQHKLISEQIDAINSLALRSGSIQDFHSERAVTNALARRGYSPRERPAMMDLWKERWNQDVRLFVRRAREMEWSGVRGKMDDAWKFLIRSTKGE